jgi:hypothetical protein
MRAVFHGGLVHNVRPWRARFFIEWVAIFGLLPWLLWLTTIVEDQNIWWPIGLSTLTVLSVLAGWQFGYKRLFGLTGAVRLHPNHTT